MTIYLGEDMVDPELLGKCVSCGKQADDTDVGFARKYGPRGVLVWWHEKVCFTPKEKYFKKRRWFQK